MNVKNAFVIMWILIRSGFTKKGTVVCKRKKNEIYILRTDSTEIEKRIYINYCGLWKGFVNWILYGLGFSISTNILQMGGEAGLKMKNTTNTHSMKSEAIYLYVEIILNWLCHVVCFFKWFDSFAFTINNTSIFVFVVFVVIAMVIFSSQNSTTHSLSFIARIYNVWECVISFSMKIDEIQAHNSEHFFYRMENIWN